MKKENSFKWHSTEDRPLCKKDQKGHLWITDDGDGEFLAAVPYYNKNRPNEELWWIHHCNVGDNGSLFIIGDDYDEPAGWSVQDVTHWHPIPEPPNKIQTALSPEEKGDLKKEALDCMARLLPPEQYGEYEDCALLEQIINKLAE